MSCMFPPSHSEVLPRSVVWSSCHSCRLSSPWSQCPPCWRRPAWRNRRRSGTRRRFCPHCCFQWWGSWTYSQSFGPKTPSARRLLLPRPSVDGDEGEKLNSDKITAVTFKCGSTLQWMTVTFPETINLIFLFGPLSTRDQGSHPESHLWLSFRQQKHFG